MQIKTAGNSFLTAMNCKSNPRTLKLDASGNEMDAFSVDVSSHSSSTSTLTAPSDTTPHCDLLIRAERKIASQLAGNRTAMKFLLDPAALCLFDNLSRVVQLFTRSKSTTGRLMKHIAKINTKIGLLVSNQLLNCEEQETLLNFQTMAYQIARILQDAHDNDENDEDDDANGECAVDNSTTHISHAIHAHTINSERLLNKLVDLVRQAGHLLDVGLLSRHTKEKTRVRLTECTEFFAQRDFLRAILSREKPYAQTMRNVCENLDELIRRDLL